MVRITTIDFPDGSRAAMLAARRPAMEINEYVLDRLVREKLDEARALAARRALISGTRSGLRARRAEADVARARPVTLRRARPDDNAQIAAIWNAALDSPIMTTDTEPRTPAAQAQWLARHGDDHPVVVAVDGAEVLAY